MSFKSHGRKIGESCGRLIAVILLIKIEWLVDDVIPVGSPDRAECGMLGIMLDVFWSIQATFVVGEPLCDEGIPV